MPDSFNGVALSLTSDIAWAADVPAPSAGKINTATGNGNRIDNAAREFEATLLTKWLEDARHACGEAPGDAEDEDGDGEHRNEMIDLGLKSLASAMAKSGGIGIARVLCHELQVRDSAGSPSEDQSKFTVGTHATLPKMNSKTG